MRKIVNCLSFDVKGKQASSGKEREEIQCQWEKSGPQGKRTREMISRIKRQHFYLKRRTRSEKNTYTHTLTVNFFSQ